MSAVFGEILTFGQANDRDIQLKVTGDEFYATYETLDGYTTVSDSDPGFFFVENRSKLGVDTHLPSSGLAVYHCDILGSNEFQQGTGQRHYQCALLQADGNTDLEHNVNHGDGTDLFGSVNGVALSNATTPSSRLWDGSDSGLVLSDIAVSDGRLNSRVGVVASAPSICTENASMVSIPDNNPAGISSKIQVAEAGVIRQLKVGLDITHTSIGDLIVELTGPGGAKATLHNRAGVGADNLGASYDSSSLAALAVFIGQGVQGDWVLNVRDVAGRDVGKLSRWSLEFLIEGGAQSGRGEATANLQISDKNPAGINRPGVVGQGKVNIDITHTYIGDLRIELVSPAGRSVVLHSQPGHDQDNLVVTYESAAPLSSLSSLIGQPIQGNWVLRVAGLTPEDVGALNKWSLEIVPTN